MPFFTKSENSQKLVDFCERNNFSIWKWGNLMVVFRMVKMGKFNLPIKSIEKLHIHKKFNLDIFFYLEKEMKIFVQRLSFMVYWDSCKVVADSGNYFWRLRKANLYCCGAQCEKLTFTKKYFVKSINIYYSKRLISRNIFQVWLWEGVNYSIFHTVFYNSINWPS